MIKNFKMFEKLGINQLAVDISKKSIKPILDEKKIKSQYCKVDISEFNITILDRDNKIMHISSIVYQLDYNNYSSSFNTNPINYLVQIRIGLLNKTGEYKTDEEIEEHIIHEVKHLIHRMYISKKLAADKLFFDKTPRFLKLSGTGSARRIVQTCKQYNINPSVDNFLLKTNNNSDLFKKTLVYFYLAEEDEIQSKLHEFYLIFKRTKNISEVIKKYENIISLFKDMCNYKLDFNLMKPEEKQEILRYFNKKDTKKVENYIRNQGKKFIKKLHKLSAFETDEN